MTDKNNQEDNNQGFVNPSQTSGLSIGDRPKPRIDVGGNEHYKNDNQVMNSLTMNQGNGMFGAQGNNAFLQSQGQPSQAHEYNRFESFKGNASIDRPHGDTQTFGIAAAFQGDSQQVGNGIFDSSLNQLPGKFSNVQTALSGPQSGTISRINVSIEFEDGESTLFKNQKIQKDETGSIMLAPLIDNIKAQGFCIRNHVVSYFSQTDRAYVFVAKDPIPSDYIIMMSDLDM